jgi:hypothetical protein
MKRGLHRRKFRVVGPEPLDVEMEELTGHEGEKRALSLAREPFKTVNPKVRIRRFRQWRTALSADRMLLPA